MILGAQGWAVIELDMRPVELPARADSALPVLTSTVNTLNTGLIYDNWKTTFPQPSGNETETVVLGLTHCAHCGTYSLGAPGGSVMVSVQVSGLGNIAVRVHFTNPCTLSQNIQSCVQG
jgi:hypothetical protein